jgi:hypothetical protein
MTGEKKIQGLINEIQNEQLILPEFQRGYVWKRPAVRSFLTSLYRGYPTGSFLIWKTPEPGKVRGPQDLDPESKYFELILDGQQRLTSIFAIMTGEPPPFYEGEKLFFDLHFNILDESFSYWKKITMQGKPEWIPVTEFFKQGFADFLQDRIADGDDTKELYIENLERLKKLDALRAYPYYVTTLTEGNMERVVEIFNLVNSAGTRLSKSDLALAHICASWPEARETFKSTQAALTEHGFGLDLDFFTRATSTVATHSALYEPLYKTPPDEIQEAWKKVERVLDHLVNLLRADAYIDSSATLKSDFPLIPLVAFLADNDAKFASEKEKYDFLHWFYAAAMWGRYSGSAETKLNADVGVLTQPDPANGLRDKLLQERGRIKVEARDLERRGAASTFYPLTYIVMRANGAKDWFNGQPLYSKNVGAVYGLERHHIFPQAVLYKSGYDSGDRVHKEMVNEIANLSFLTKQANIKISANDPLAYLSEVKDTYPGALEAQFVPMDESLWTVEKFPDFLAVRRTLIAEGINSFMDELLAEPDESETTIEDLIKQGESETIEYKSSLRWDYRQGNSSKVVQKAVAKTLAAFVNTSGGTLVIGLKDDGEVLGLDNDLKTLGSKSNLDGWELSFNQTVTNYLGADIAAVVEMLFTEVEGKTIAVVSCQPHGQPVFLNDGEDVEFWVRTGNSSRKLNVLETSKYIHQRWPSGVSAEPVAA